MTLNIPTGVLTTLTNVLQNNPDDLARVLHFLANGCRDGTAAPYIQTLQSVIQVPNAFKLLALRYAQETRQTRDSDDAYQQHMQVVWRMFLSESSSDYPDDGTKMKLAVSKESLLAVVSFNFKEIVNALPVEMVASLMSFMNERQLKGTIVAIRNVNPLVCDVALVAVSLSVSVIKNVRRWWVGEITGKRCLKNIIDCGIGSIATVAIGTGFVAIGGPIGGAVFITAFSLITANTLSDRLMQYLFGLPQNESLENAYKTLRVVPTASNSAINSSFQDLESEYSRQGNQKMWLELQFSMLVIKEARRKT